MVASCCAYNCTQRFKKGIGFHKFPKDKILHKKWLDSMRRKDWKPTASSRICCQHFTSDSYEQSGWSSKKYLKATAIPTIFSFPDNPKKGMKARTPPGKQKGVHVKPKAGSSVTIKNKPVKEAIKPVREPIEQVREVSEELREANAPVREANKEVREVDVRIREVDVRVREAHVQVTEAKKQVIETKEQIRETEERVREAIEQVREVREQLREVNEPVREANEPVREVNEQVKEANEQGREANEAVREANKPRQKKKKREYYIGDFDENEVIKPGKASQILNICKKVISQKNRQIKVLKQAKQRLLKKINNLEAMVHILASEI